MDVVARVQTDAGPRYAIPAEEGWSLLSDAPWGMPFVTSSASAGAHPVVPTVPSKIVAIGQNYAKHAQEMGKPIPKEPLIFLKPVSALNGHDSPIILPADSEEVHHEAELALIIGKTLKNVSEAEAADGIWGASCFNDVTARDVQRREIQHTRAKGYDTFACLGPWIVRGLDLNDLRVSCRVNGQLRQDGRTSDMVFKPAALVSFISKIMTLVPGDVVSTGTPSGVGKLEAGDVVEVEIEGVGVLRNPVAR